MTENPERDLNVFCVTPESRILIRMLSLMKPHIHESMYVIDYRMMTNQLLP